jgi:dCTP deaminase
MILSDREIRAALDRDSVRITPDPRQNAALWASTAIDLHLDGELAYWEHPTVASAPVPVSPSHPDYNYAQLVEQWARQITLPADGYLVAPGAFLLGWTVEKIRLPYRSRIAARVEGKSSLARLGLGVHVTAPTIHAGFGYKEAEPLFAGNPVQLEIWNFGPLTIRLEKGMRICQLIFEEVHGTPEKGYEGQFVLQGPAQLPATPATGQPPP